MNIEINKKIEAIFDNATKEGNLDMFGEIKNKVWTEVAPTMPGSTDPEISKVVMNIIQQSVLARMSKPIDVKKALYS
ncbi:MAG: hypothetical protein RPS47_04800 [Colwellia sp.]